jgi:hypothetical protein
MLEEAWGIIANVCGGDWSTQSDAWRAAANRLGDALHKTPDQPVEMSPEPGVIFIDRRPS